MVPHKQYHKPKHKWNLDDVILLDSSYKTKLTLMNTNLVTNIKPGHNPLYISTNEETNKTTLQGNVKKFGDVWYDSTQIANIFVLSYLSDKHRITYNNWE